MIVLIIHTGLGRRGRCPGAHGAGRTDRHTVHPCTRIGMGTPPMCCGDTDVPVCTRCSQDHRWLITLPSFMSGRHVQEPAPAVQALKA